MTKEEIKEMIDATINENGKGNITGKALNLALNAIVDAMGEGGGLDTVYLIPFNPTETESLSETDSFWTMDDVVSRIEHNKTIYEKITNKFINEKSAPQISVDLSIFAYGEYGREAIANVGAGIICFKISESMPTSMSWNEYDHYNSGDIAVLITPYYEAWMDFSTDYITFWLHSDGTCGFANNGGNVG